MALRKIQNAKENICVTKTIVNFPRTVESIILRRVIEEAAENSADPFPFDILENALRAFEMHDEVDDWHKSHNESYPEDVNRIAQLVRGREEEKLKAVYYSQKLVEKLKELKL